MEAGVGAKRCEGREIAERIMSRAARGESPRTISAIVKQIRYGPTAVPAVAWASRGHRDATVLP